MTQIPIQFGAPPNQTRADPARWDPGGGAGDPAARDRNADFHGVFRGARAPHGQETAKAAVDEPHVGQERAAAHASRGAADSDHPEAAQGAPDADTQGSDPSGGVDRGEKDAHGEAPETAVSSLRGENKEARPKDAQSTHASPDAAAAESAAPPTSRGAGPNTAAATAGADSQAVPEPAAEKAAASAEGTDTARSADRGKTGAGATAETAHHVSGAAHFFNRSGRGMEGLRPNDGHRAGGEGPALAVARGRTAGQHALAEGSPFRHGTKGGDAAARRGPAAGRPAATPLSGGTEHRAGATAQPGGGIPVPAALHARSDSAKARAIEGGGSLGQGDMIGTPEARGAPSVTAGPRAAQVTAQAPDLPRSVAVQVAEAAGRAGGERAVELHLRPAELGRVAISLTSGDGGGVSVSILAERPETLDLMRRHIGLLTQELQDLGYEATDFAFDQGASQAPPDSPETPEEETAAPHADGPPSDDAVQSPGTGAWRLLADRVDIRL